MLKYDMQREYSLLSLKFNELSSFIDFVKYCLTIFFSNINKASEVFFYFPRNVLKAAAIQFPYCIKL